MVIDTLAFVTNCHPANADRFTRSPFAHLMMAYQMRDRIPLNCGRHHFFPKRFFKAALSSIASVKERFGFVFLSSNVFCRFASDTFIPPNLAFHL